MLYMEFLRGLLRPGRKHPVSDSDVRKIASTMTEFGKRSVRHTSKMTAEEYDAKVAEAMEETDGDLAKVLEIMKAHAVS